MVGVGLSADDGSPTGRLFAAIVPPTDVVLALADVTSRWDVPGKLVPPENWHITLRFVGGLDDVTWDRWRAGLDESDLGGPMRVRLGRPGAFPKPRKATVVFAQVDAPEMEDLAEVVEEATVAAGIDPEERPFHPHLTLARVRPPADVRELTERTEATGISWTADRIHLMAGVGNRSAEAGHRYHSFESFPLR